MKKLAILLGTLAIAASAFAGGKEVVPAPVGPTVIKEVERVVYRDRTDVGDLEIYYRWWGQSNIATSENDHFLVLDEGAPWLYEGKGKIEKRAGNGNRGRLRIIGNVQLTERNKIHFRVTDNHAIGSIGKTTASFREETGLFSEKLETFGRSGEVTEVRLRFSHKHDLLNATSRLHYQNNGEYTGFAAGEHNLEYQFQIPLAEYFFDNDFIKTTAFTLAPKVGYAWDHSSGSAKSTVGADRTYYGGVDLYTFHTLPWNFSFEFNLYTGYYNANKKIYDDKKSDLGIYAEAYLRNKTPLVEFTNSTLYFAFEGGFDPYKWSQRKLFGHAAAANLAYINAINPDETGLYATEEDGKSSYSVYAWPALQLDYKPTDNITITTIAGVEYRNTLTNSSEAQGWVWQPVVQTGFKVKF